jgi:hypothetical protein
VELAGHRYEVWQLTRAADGKRHVRFLVSAPTLGLARAAANEAASRAPDAKVVIQDRVHRRWFKS